MFDIVTLSENIWVVQGIGLLAFLVMAGALQCSARTAILYWQVLGMGLLGFHFILLDALTGVVMMGILMVRNLVFAQKEIYPSAAHVVVLYVTLLFVVLGGALSWQGWGSLSAIAGSFVATYGFWQTSPRRLRLITLVSVFVWLPYGIITESYPLLLLQAFLFTSLVIAIWRYDWKPKNLD